MRRRDFIAAATALSAAGAGALWERRHLAATAEYPGRAAGHRLRDRMAPGALPEPTESVDTEVLIAGAGIAGLTAAWQLTKHGVRDLLLVAGPENFGNAAGGADGELKFPTGAHYLPLPSLESTHIREMLEDFGIIQREAFGPTPTFDERWLVHSPAERVLYRGTWQEGYLPSEEVSAAERADHTAFFAVVEAMTSARGSDGRRAFAVPLAQSSADAQFRDLDRLTFKAWLDGRGWRSPSLHWYLDYCCRDDYGRRYDEVSAWAGLHYFCSRDGRAANAERGAVLTWPEGLSALASRLSDAAAARSPWPSASVARLRETADGVEAWVVISPEGAAPRVCRVTARHAVAAMPLYVLQHVLAEPAAHGFAPPRDVPAYAPWLVANFLMRAFPEEQPGAPLSWDNVVYQEPGLGYVVSTHQDIRLSRPERTAFTAYHALSEQTPEAGRRWLDSASIGELAQFASRDLDLAYGWRLPFCVERVAVTVRGHAMAIPRPGFLSIPGRIALREATGRLQFAHSDLSGLSLFEEAAWWGHRAAGKVLDARA